MPLVVNGTAAERATIQGWLNEICWRIRVNPATGAVTSIAGPPQEGAFVSGCDCLDSLMRDRGRTVTIQPLAGPRTPLPGGNGMTVGDLGGGATDRPAGSDGTGPDGKAGADCTAYVDISNNGGGSYPHGAPMWLVLAHELTSGHAFHNARGTAAATVAEQERQAITSENTHRQEHRLPARPLPP